MVIVKTKLLSHGPLLMSNTTMLNRRHPLTRELTGLFAIAKKRKTEEHLDREEELQNLTSIYIDQQIGPYLPSTMLRACVIAGARVTRNGKDVENGLTFLEDKVALQYEGPRTAAGLWKAAETFDDYRSVMRGRIAVMTVRPKFPEWSATFEVALDPTVIDSDAFSYYLAVGGRLKGIGAYRSMFGRFTVEVDGRQISANDPPGGVMAARDAPRVRERKAA
jgi:hypothetical protein